MDESGLGLWSAGAAYRLADICGRRMTADTKQEAQLSQKGCSTLRVIDYSAKSLKFMKNDSMTPLGRACASPYTILW